MARVKMRQLTRLCKVKGGQDKFRIARNRQMYKFTGNTGCLVGEFPASFRLEGSYESKANS
jgi:hypothetical protein